MLLKKEKPAQIDPLENWPEHYYEIENAKERKEILAQAISRGLDLPNDNYRMKLLEKRYGKDGKSDAFMKAWMMIKASGAAGISFFNKRHLQKELKQYMKDLCLLEYAPENETEQAVLLTEWENFAKFCLPPAREAKLIAPLFLALCRSKMHPLQEKSRKRSTSSQELTHKSSNLLTNSLRSAK